MAEERTGEAAEHYEQARKFDESEDYAKAVDEYSEVIKLNPDDLAAYDFRGRAYIQLGKTNEAKADLQKCLHICRLTKTREMEGYMWGRFGYTFQSVGNNAEAYNCYKGGYSCGDTNSKMGLMELDMWDLLADRPIYGGFKEEKPVNAQQEKRVLTEEEKKQEKYNSLVQRMNNAWNNNEILQDLVSQFRSMGGYKDAAERASKCESRIPEIIKEKQREKLKRMLLGTVIGLAAGVGFALCLTILLPIAVQFFGIVDSDFILDSDFYIPITLITLIIILIPAIVVTVKIKGGFWSFVFICVPWGFGVAAYCEYAVPFLLKASNSLIALMVGAAAIVGAGVGALIGAKKKKK